MIGTTIDLIIRRKIVDSGLRLVAEIGGQPPDQGTDHHEDQDPLGDGDTAEERPDSGHRAASAPVLASMPASTAACEAANLATPSVFQLASDQPSGRCPLPPAHRAGRARRRRWSWIRIAGIAVIPVGVERLGRKGVHGLGRRQRLDVVNVRKAGILGAGGRPERPLRTGPRPRQPLPARGRQCPLEDAVGHAGIGNGDLCPRSGDPASGPATRRPCRPPGSRRSSPPRRSA